MHSMGSQILEYNYSTNWTHIYANNQGGVGELTLLPLSNSGEVIQKV
jgi:hypothetical protein